MTPAEQQRQWDQMSYPQRLQMVAVLFDLGELGEVVWHTAQPFHGYHLWYRMRWYGD